MACKTKMHPFPMLFLIALLFSFISLQVSARSCQTLVAPIIKDPKTSLYTITLNSREKYVIDINAPLSWRLCQKNPPSPVFCSAPQCTQARSFLPGMCPEANNIWMKYGHCQCIVTPVNPVAKSCAPERLTYNNFMLSWTNGKNPTGDANLNKIYYSCAPTTLFKSLPEGVSGLAALSRAPLAFSSQFTPAFVGMTKKFAICLPSATGNIAPGVTFFGNGPYYFGYYMPTQFDVSKVLSYTPLLKKSNSVEYYVGLKGISINGKASKLLPNAFAFDSRGNGGVKLSTIVPYTILRSDIYNTLLKDFYKATKNVPRVKNVSPFGLCVKASSLGWTRIGLVAPTIELGLGNGVIWRIYGTNSMKEVGGDVACLAFVDGGKTAKEAAVIGAYQMENHFLEFDLAASRLGFSDSLYTYRASCASFNLTSAV
ncbi:Peptidase A1 [Corchorus olitorius]|uniref:Peptidase A1 n=1 Tax=Corchorus olitorius TaxID=93759 RepID=A0A1R3HV91_9ROSI|nr:Peptidase A1 [Corchorus olitorius]